MIKFLLSIPTQRIFTFTFFVLIITACFSIGMFNYDEHFEILEFAAFKHGFISKDQLTWEYGAEISSGVQAWIAYLIICGLDKVEAFNPFVVATITRILAALISFISIVLSYRVLKDHFSSDSARRLFLITHCLLWFVIYHSVRFSSEAVSGSLLIIGISLILMQSRRAWPHILTAAVAIGLATVIRYPIGLCAVGVLLWLLFNKQFKAAIIVLSGIVVCQGLGLIVDKWLYNTWTFTPLNYIQQNILQHRAEEFGRAPWWYYLWNITDMTIPPFSLLYITSYVWLLIKHYRHIIVWCSLPYVIALHLIDYKSINQLVPLIGFAPFILCFFCQNLYMRLPLKYKSTGVWLTKVFYVINFIVLLAVLIAPASMLVKTQQKIFQHSQEPAILYFASAVSPFNFGIDMNFYKSQYIDVQYVATIEEIVPIKNRTVLVAIDKNQDISSIPCESVQIASTIPDFILRFNFGNWVQRTEYWRIYRCMN